MRPTGSTARARLDGRLQQLLARYGDALDRAEAELADPGGLADPRGLAVMTEHDAVALENIVTALDRVAPRGR